MTKLNRVAILIVGSGFALFGCGQASEPGVPSTKARSAQTDQSRRTERPLVDPIRAIEEGFEQVTEDSRKRIATLRIPEDLPQRIESASPDELLQHYRTHVQPALTLIADVESETRLRWGTLTEARQEEQRELERLARDEQLEIVHLVVGSPTEFHLGFQGIDQLSDQQVYIETILYRPERLGRTVRLAPINGEFIRAGDIEGVNAYGVAVKVPRYIDPPMRVQLDAHRTDTERLFSRAASILSEILAPVTADIHSLHDRILRRAAKLVDDELERVSEHAMTAVTVSHMHDILDEALLEVRSIADATGAPLASSLWEPIIPFASRTRAVLDESIRRLNGLLEDARTELSAGLERESASATSFLESFEPERNGSLAASRATTLFRELRDGSARRSRIEAHAAHGKSLHHELSRSLTRTIEENHQRLFRQAVTLLNGHLAQLIDEAKASVPASTVHPIAETAQESFGALRWRPGVASEIQAILEESLGRLNGPIESAHNTLSSAIDTELIAATPFLNSLGPGTGIESRKLLSDLQSGNLRSVRLEVYTAHAAELREQLSSRLEVATRRLVEARQRHLSLSRIRAGRVDHVVASRDAVFAVWHVGLERGAINVLRCKIVRLILGKQDAAADLLFDDVGGHGAGEALNPSIRSRLDVDGHWALVRRARDVLVFTSRGEVAGPLVLRQKPFLNRDDFLLADNALVIVIANRLLAVAADGEIVVIATGIGGNITNLRLVNRRVMADLPPSPFEEQSSVVVGIDTGDVSVEPSKSLPRADGHQLEAERPSGDVSFNATSVLLPLPVDGQCRLTEGTIRHGEVEVTWVRLDDDAGSYQKNLDNVSRETAAFHRGWFYFGSDRLEMLLVPH